MISAKKTKKKLHHFILLRLVYSSCYLFMHQNQLLFNLIVVLAIFIHFSNARPILRLSRYVNAFQLEEMI